MDDQNQNLPNDLQQERPSYTSQEPFRQDIVNNNNQVPNSTETIPSPADINKEINNSQLPTNSKHKSKKLVLVIAVALVLILAAVGVYLMMNGSNDKKETTDKTQQNNSQQAPVNATDVSKTSEEIDSSVKTLDETNDISDTDLSDSSLGL